MSPLESVTKERDALRRRCSDLHRRCQQLESAVTQFKKQWDAHGGPKGGGFGRALLASYCVKLEAEIAKLRQKP